MTSLLSTRTGPVRSDEHRGAPVSRVSARRVGLRGLNYLIVIGVVLIYVFPLLYLVNTALKRPEEFIRNPSGIAQGIALQNFVDAWSQGGFGNLIVNSVVYALASATISVLLSVLIAFPVARGYVRFSRGISLLFALALFLPNSIISQFQLMLQLDLYNTRIGFVLLSTAGLGIGPLLIVAYLRTLPRELDEAAAMDGCGYFRYIWTFVIPLCRPVLVTVFILQAIGVWNDIIGPTIYLSSPQLQTVAQGLLSFYGQNGNNQWALLAAATLMIAAPLLVLYVSFQRFFVAGATSGALR